MEAAQTHTSNNNHPQNTFRAPVNPPAFDFNAAFNPSGAFHGHVATTGADDQPIAAPAAEGEQNGVAWQPEWLGGFSNEYFTIDTPLNGGLAYSSGMASSAGIVSLPPQGKLAELADVYFRRVHHFLPVLHEATFRDSLGRIGASDYPSALIFAVISLATCERQDQLVLASKVQWYKEAKEQYASSGHLPAHPIPTLQTAVCLIFQGMMINDFSSTWLILGKAWRQVVALGYHRLDSDSGRAMPGAPPLPQDWIQRESVRRIIWTLYILDRGLCFPVGLVHSIEDKHVNINLPMEDLFQQSIRHDEATAVPFTPSFNKLLTSIRQTATRTKHENKLHYIILTYMLLGHIVAHYHLSDNSDQSEKESCFRSLESCLVNLRLSLPRSVTSLSAAPFDDLTNITWLNVVMNINTIFLYHGRDADADNKAATHWHHCLTAARNTAALIREAGPISTDLLLNPHTASPLFCCSRILIIEYLVPSQPGDVSSSATGGLSTPTWDPQASPTSQTSVSTARDPALKQDLDLALLVFERLAEPFGPIGLKSKLGMVYHLGQDVETALRIKENGIKDIMSRCASWGAGPPGFGDSL
ncbi:hypothetical protein DL770_008199 [Monosporascus sp. CRB-9-2]|nr:hypothetical protein DL770_008199 [Monosporascus sp. CRB-9-2]